MTKNPIMDVSLSDIMRSEIALPLQHVLNLYTVGNFLRAWRNPRIQKNIEQLFDSPDQARHAAATCAAWLGVESRITPNSVPRQWWLDDRVATTPQV